MVKQIKLAIVGGSSSGKTTLFKELEEEYKNNPDVAFVHESAREYFLSNPSSDPFILEVQEKILDLALENEKSATLKNSKIIVTDTSALEVMFYTKVRGDEKGAERLYKRLASYIPSYTKFLLLNHAEVPFENDIVRKEDKDTRDKIHQMLEAFYKNNDLEFEKINGTIDQRRKKVSAIILKYLEHEE